MHAQFDYLNQILILATLAISLNLLMGYAGQPSIAHPAFAAVGGYGAALVAVHQGLGFVPSAIVGVVAGAVAGMLIALPAVRLTTDYIVLLTLAALYIEQSVINAVPLLGGDAGIFGVPQVNGLNTPQRYLVLTGGFALLTLLVSWALGSAPYGRALRAIREDEQATQAIGQNIYLLKATVFSLTSGMAALAGVLLAFYNGFVSNAQFTPQMAVMLFSIVIIGGSGNVLGSLLGAVVIVELDPFLKSVFQVDPIYSSTIQQIVYGLLLTLFVLVRPQGIVPERLGKFRARPEATGKGSTAASIIRSRLGLPAPAMPKQRTREHPVPAATPAPVAPRTSVRPDAAPELSQEGSASTGTAGSDGNDAAAAVALEVRSLKKHFGGIRAVDGVDLDIVERRITSLIGPNGAGKSTLFGLFTGFTTPDTGSVRLFGQELVGYSPHRIAHLGLVRSFQDIRLFLGLSCLDNIRIAVPEQTGTLPHQVIGRPAATRRSAAQASERAMELLEFVGLEKHVNRAAGDLAYAEQKVLAIARSLATGARVLLLDEPTSGMDPGALDTVAELIRALPTIGRTVCVVEHNLGFLQALGGECYFLEAGRVTAKGGLSDLMGDEHLRKAYFGV